MDASLSIDAPTTSPEGCGDLAEHRGIRESGQRDGALVLRRCRYVRPSLFPSPGLIINPTIGALHADT